MEQTHYQSITVDSDSVLFTNNFHHNLPSSGLISSSSTSKPPVPSCNNIAEGSGNIVTGEVFHRLGKDHYIFDVFADDEDGSAEDTRVTKRQKLKTTNAVSRQLLPRRRLGRSPEIVPKTTKISQMRVKGQVAMKFLFLCRYSLTVSLSGTVLQAQTADSASYHLNILLRIITHGT